MFLLVMTSPIKAQLDLSQREIEKLSSVTIAEMEIKHIKVTWPRQVGKNSRLDVHGFGPETKFAVINTNEYQGIGQTNSINDVKLNTEKDILIGKSIWSAIDPSTLMVKKEYRTFDIAIYDIIGVILNKPAYKLFGKPVSNRVKCYSGMIYCDDLEYDTYAAGLKQVLDNCQYDYDLGYRYFKLKIGRGGKWMERGAGLERDIEITKEIHKKFPDVTILVDANDAYTVEECIEYLEGISPIEPYWVEEPFRENKEDYEILHEWRIKNAPNIRLADGELKPIKNLLLDLGSQGIIDVYLPDIIGVGFSNWLELGAELKSRGIMGSPHNWGTYFKTVYSAHFAMAFGNVDIIEGVTIVDAEEVDFGEFNLKNGYFIPSKKAGFGMTLKK